MYEILLILVLTLVVVGPEQLPKVARALGKGINAVRRLALEFQYALEESVRDEEEEKRKREDVEKAKKTADGVETTDRRADDPYGLGAVDGAVAAGPNADEATRPDAEPVTGEGPDRKDDPDDAE